MISASKAFKEKLKKGANVVNYADFTLSDGTVLHLEPKDFMIGGCQIEDKTTDGKFGVGFAIGKTLTLRIANHDERFSRYDFYGSVINLYVALLLDNGTVEKIRKGVYYTIVPETPGDVIEISAVDGMFKLDRDYSSSRTSYPATLQRIISDACLDCGIPIGLRQFDNMSYTVKEKPDQGTYRQIISYACQIAGYNARIDNNGYMQLVWYNTSLLDAYNYKGGDFHNYPHDTVVNGGNFTNYGSNTILSGGSFADAMPEHIFRIKSINVHTDDVQITGVRVSGQEEKTVLFGEEGYLVEVKENPFANGNEQAVANYLGGRMVGMVFRPFSAEVLNNPLYEPFDIVRASDAKGNVYYSLLNSVSYKIGSYTTVACEAEDPVRNGSTYVSAAAQAVVEARRDTEKQLTTYDKAVQNMNQLTANAMGLFTKSEKQSDGSSIFYQSTKPITVDANGKCHFEAGSTVYKKQGEGFFVSRDGGKTYSSGFDADGNAVLNVLYAIGIVCDWIRGGTLTLGGENNTDGFIKIMDANGTQIGKIDKDGISGMGTFDLVKAFSYKNGKPDWGTKSYVNMIDYRIKNRDYTSYGFRIFSGRLDQDTDTSHVSGYGDICLIPQNPYYSGSGRPYDTPFGNMIYSRSGLNIVSQFYPGQNISSSHGSWYRYSRIDMDDEQVIISICNEEGTSLAGIRVDTAGVRFIGNKVIIPGISPKSPGTHEFTTMGVTYNFDGNAYSKFWFNELGTQILRCESLDVDGGSDFYGYANFHSDVTIDFDCDLKVKSLGRKTSDNWVVWNSSTGKFQQEGSSSKRYKDIDRNMTNEDVELFYQIQPVYAKYKEGYLDENDDRCGMVYPMLIAEDVGKYFPEAVSHLETGEIENWSHRVLIPAMFQMLKSQKETIDNQQAEIESLTARIERLEALLLIRR